MSTNCGLWLGQIEKEINAAFKQAHSQNPERKGRKAGEKFKRFSMRPDRNTKRFNLFAAAEKSEKA
jgi:hypothetical protein